MMRLAPMSRRARAHDQADRSDQIRRHNAAGIEAAKEGRHAAAVLRFQRAFQLDTRNPAPIMNAGVEFLAMGRLDEAQGCLLAAIALKPDLAGAHDNLGVVLKHRGDHAGSVAAHREALRLEPGCRRTVRNLAVALECDGQFDEALRIYDDLLVDEPDDRELRFGRGVVRLVLGDMGGMDELDRRLDRPANHAQEIPGVPRWDDTPLPHGTLLVNQLTDGFGDAIMGIRSSWWASQRVGRVVVLCRKPIASLMARAHGVGRVVCPGDPLPHIDAQVAALGLPWRSGEVSDGRIPGVVPYLRPDPTASAHWCRRLHRLGETTVGVVWQGDPSNCNDERRSFGLRHLAPLADVPGVRLVSLQKGTGTDQLDDCGFPVIDLNTIPHYREGDMLETAAAMEGLDLIVSCDTGLAHLAGAIARPTWLALPHVPEWRWQLNRPDSPWYPTMRLFRQPSPGDWGSVFRSMAEALKGFAA